jgi:hypothetical protein
MWENVLKASIELRSLFRHGRTETCSEIATFANRQNVIGNSMTTVRTSN